jgi:flagellar hook-associated protein 1 FlgK
MKTMTTISGSIYSALSAMNTYQIAINVTNANIANVETEGYTRQKAVIQTKNPGTTSSISIGTGVEVSSIKRVYENFITSQLRSAKQSFGKYEAEQEILSSIETVFSDSDDSGLSVALSEFWSGWQDVVNDPSDSTARSVLASSSDTLADTFNTMSSELTDIQKNLDNSVLETVDSINELVQQIADMNQKIAQAGAAGQNTNTYQDSLDSLVLELSSLIDVKTYTNSSGQICVQLANGKPLVEGTATWSLSTETNATTGHKDVTWEDSDGNVSVVNDVLSSGKLAGYLDVRDNIITTYQDQLDELAMSIMEQVNSIHTSGYDISGNIGVSFFTGTGASDMKVNSEILNDPGKIAASATADGAPGDASNAAAIAELENSLLLADGTTTFSDYYSALVSKVGTTVELADLKYNAQSALVTSYENQRDSVSGVSLDEEQVKLVLYQNVYEAAAKMISVLDELLETIIEM